MARSAEVRQPSLGFGASLPSVVTREYSTSSEVSISRIDVRAHCGRVATCVQQLQLSLSLSVCKTCVALRIGSPIATSRLPMATIFLQESIVVSKVGEIDDFCGYSYLRDYDYDRTMRRPHLPDRVMSRPPGSRVTGGSPKFP